MLTQNYIKHSLKEYNGNYSIIHENFFDYHSEELFDVIVMGEVL
jgi:hypothetical protein